MLGVDQTTVDGDIEHAPTSLNQRRLHTDCLLDTGRQTGGSWHVISLHAILDRYLHHEISDSWIRTTARLYRGQVAAARYRNHSWEGCTIGLKNALRQLYNKWATDYIPSSSVCAGVWRIEIFDRQLTGNSVRIRDGPAAVTGHYWRNHSAGHCSCDNLLNGGSLPDRQAGVRRPGSPGSGVRRPTSAWYASLFEGKRSCGVICAQGW